MPSKTVNDLIDFQLDRYTNAYIPPNRIDLLPYPVARYLGYRKTPQKEPPATVQWVLTIFANIAAICLVGGVYNYAPGIKKWHPPTIVASLGASAILYYNAPGSPLGQPRNSLVGHTLAAIVGTGVSKLFQLNPELFAKYDWVASAFALAGASLAMSISNSVHPPGGATAILACTEPQIIAMGWMFVPMILLASALMLGVALLFNNTLRRYPSFWWTSGECGSKLPFLQKRGRDEKPAEKPTSNGDAEKGQQKQQERSSSPESANSSLTTDRSHDGSDSQRTLEHQSSLQIWHREGLDAVHIAPHRIMMPAHVAVSAEEAEVLRRLMHRLGKKEEEFVL